MMLNVFTPIERLIIRNFREKDTFNLLVSRTQIHNILLFSPKKAPGWLEWPGMGEL